MKQALWLIVELNGEKRFEILTQAIEKQGHCYFRHIDTFLYEDGEKPRFLVQERTTDLNAHVSTSSLEQLVKLTLVNQEEQHEYERQ